MKKADVYKAFVPVNLALTVYRPNCCPLSSIYHHHLLCHCS